MYFSSSDSGITFINATLVVIRFRSYCLHHANRLVDLNFVADFVPSFFFPQDNFLYHKPQLNSVISMDSFILV